MREIRTYGLKGGLRWWGLDLIVPPSPEVYQRAVVGLPLTLDATAMWHSAWIKPVCMIVALWCLGAAVVRGFVVYHPSILPDVRVVKGPVAPRDPTDTPVGC
jgi:hypothetical protein